MSAEVGVSPRSLPRQPPQIVLGQGSLIYVFFPSLRGQPHCCPNSSSWLTFFLCYPGLPRGLRVGTRTHQGLQLSNSHKLTMSRASPLNPGGSWGCLLFT